MTVLTGFLNCLPNVTKGTKVQLLRFNCNTNRYKYYLIDSAVWRTWIIVPTHIIQPSEVHSLNNIYIGQKKIKTSSDPKQHLAGLHHTSVDLGSLFEKKRSVRSTSESMRDEMNGMDEGNWIPRAEKNTNTKSGEITWLTRRWCTCRYPLLLFYYATQRELFFSQFTLFCLKYVWN